MFGERWERILRERASLVALHAPSYTLTFGDLDAQARSFHFEDEVVLAQGDTPDILRATLAGLLRCVPVQFVEKDRERRIPAVPVPAGTAFIKQTVGGSGLRRCQFFSFAQMAADVDRLHHALDLSRRGVAVAAISCAHSYGLSLTVLQTLLNGIPLCWAPQPFAQPLMEAIRHHERAFLPGVPAMWKAWLMGQVSFTNISLAISAGSPLTLELEAMAREKHGLKLHNLYGASECGTISWDASDEPRADGGELGTLLPGVEVESSADGCWLVKSESVGLGYDEAVPGEIFGNGQFLSCDTGLAENGHLSFEKSCGQGINVAGRKLSPDEIARKIRQAGDLAEVHVFGASSRDPERCQDIVVRLPLPPSEIDVAFKTKVCAALAPWEVPRRWLGTE